MGQTIPQFPSNLVFYDSLELNSLQMKLAKFWGLLTQVKRFIPMFWQKKNDYKEAFQLYSMK